MNEDTLGVDEDAFGGMRGDIGLPRGLAYPCLCETMLMAFAGDTGAALGAASVDHARRMRDAARRFAHLGFTLADPLSFGRPVTWPAASVDVVPV